jgi:hypothetical protein
VRTGITSLAGALASASVVLTAAIICAGAASADQSQQDQFLALLEQDQIPAVDNVPALIARAHQICGELDGGTSIRTVVDEEMNGMFQENPAYRQQFARVRRTAIRFIAVSSEVYCPSHLSDPLDSDLGSDVGFANPALGWNGPTHRVAAYTRNAVNSGGDLREPRPVPDVINMPAPRREPTGTGTVRLPHLMDCGVLVGCRPGGDRSDFDAHATALASLIGAIPSGDITDPNPPQVPTPPPPTAQMLPPPRPIATPPPPKQPPPPPKQAEPPAFAPQPGGAAGSGGSGSNGGDGPAEPSPAPAPPMPSPGWVRLAP